MHLKCFFLEKDSNKFLKHYLDQVSGPKNLSYAKSTTCEFKDVCKSIYMTPLMKDERIHETWKL